MKRSSSHLLIAMAAASLALPSLALADPGDRDHYRDRERDRGAQGDRGPQGEYDRHDQMQPDPYNSRQDRYERRNGERRHGNWNERRHNGYMAQGRWFYGPPPAYGNYEPGYRAWTRGQYLAPYYRNGGYIRDYSSNRLRPPPRGYAWIRAGDNLLLINMRTGLIMEVVISNW